MSIHEEIRAAPTLQDIIHGHPMYINVVSQYVRPKQVNYVREALSAVIKDVIAMEDLDLETDPVAVRFLLLYFPSLGFGVLNCLFGLL